MVLTWRHRSPLVSQPWQRECSMRVPPLVFQPQWMRQRCTFPLVFHLNLDLRPQIIVLRLDEGNQQQIYMGQVHTTPLTVGDGREVVPIPPWFSITWLLVFVFSSSSVLLWSPTWSHLSTVSYGVHVEGLYLYPLAMKTHLFTQKKKKAFILHNIITETSPPTTFALTGAIRLPSQTRSLFTHGK